jgi:hypothetical protein
MVDVMSDITHVMSTGCSENSVSCLSTDCREQSLESCGKCIKVHVLNMDSLVCRNMFIIHSMYFVTSALFKATGSQEQ